MLKAKILNVAAPIESRAHLILDWKCMQFKVRSCAHFQLVLFLMQIYLYKPARESITYKTDRK